MTSTTTAAPAPQQNDRAPFDTGHWACPHTRRQHPLGFPILTLFFLHITFPPTARSYAPARLRADRGAPGGGHCRKRGASNWGFRGRASKQGRTQQGCSPPVPCLDGGRGDRACRVRESPVGRRSVAAAASIIVGYAPPPSTASCCVTLMPALPRTPPPLPITQVYGGLYQGGADAENPFGLLDGVRVSRRGASRAFGGSATESDPSRKRFLWCVCRCVDACCVRGLGGPGRLDWRCCQR